MSDKEPDDTPLTREHVEKFLAWYRNTVKKKTIGMVFNPDWWWSGLHSLTLGELRNGIRSLQRFETEMLLSPPEFWGLCKGQRDEKAIAAFRAMRETVRNAPPLTKKTKEPA
jgi:hypothetical protein